MVRLALLAAVALGLGACNTSYSYFQEERSEAEADTTMFGTLMTMTGIVPEERAPIEARPRPPLAIPGSNDLPDPDSATAAEAAVNFPVDESERERQRRAALAETSGDGLPEQPGLEGMRTERASIQDIQALRREGGGLNSGRVTDHRSVGHARLSREEMRSTHRSSRTDGRAILTEDGTPTRRRSLAMPPDRYRTPAETAELPEPGDIENSEWVKKRIYKVEDRRPARMLKNQ